MSTKRHFLCGMPCPFPAQRHFTGRHKRSRGKAGRAAHQRVIFTVISQVIIGSSERNIKISPHGKKNGEFCESFSLKILKLVQKFQESKQIKGNKLGTGATGLDEKFRDHENSLQFIPEYLWKISCKSMSHVDKESLCRGS